MLAHEDARNEGGGAMAGDRWRELLAELTVEEKAGLVAGTGVWTAGGVERLGIGALKLSDGPAGVRGDGLLGAGTPTACLPCGASLGATWDPDLLEELGALAGDEAAAKGVHVLLAPTVNLHRSPVRGPQLRVLLRGSAAVGPPRRRVRAGRPVAGRGRGDQALHGQRLRARAPHHRRPRRRANPARDGAATLQGGRCRRPAHGASWGPTTASTAPTAASTSGCWAPCCEKSGDSTVSSCRTGSPPARPSARLAPE